MPDILERFERHRHDVATRLAVQRADNADTTTILFVLWIIGMARHQSGLVLEVEVDFVAHYLCLFFRLRNK